MNIDELEVICDTLVELTKLRQSECKHLCIEKFAPECFGNLLREFDQVGDWKKAFGITTIDCFGAYEEYYATGDGLITGEKMAKHLQSTRTNPFESDTNSKSERLIPLTFSFLVKEDMPDKTLNKFLENIEKSFLLQKIRGDSSWREFKFLKPEGSNLKFVTLEYLEDMADADFDEELKAEAKGKRIYFFSRRDWNIERRRAFQSGDAILKVSARFNFLVLDEWKQ